MDRSNRSERESYMAENKKEKQSLRHTVFTILGWVLCAIFGFMLICNLTIIIKGTLHPEMPPSVLGTTPMAVLSGSMSGTAEDHIEVGDLIFINKIEPEELEAGDVIAYMDGTMVVTHRIVEVQTAEDGSIQWITKGDANNSNDLKPISETQLVGIYTARIPKVGDIALFLQQPLGMVLFIGIPLLAFIIYDIIRRQRYAHRENKKNAELQAEIERLRALAGEKSGEQ